jgi:hypothetical protein
MGIPLLPQGILSRYFRFSRRGRLPSFLIAFSAAASFFALRPLASEAALVSAWSDISTGCVLIGPVGVGLISGILDTARRSGRIGLEGGPFEPPYWNNAY